jgi:peptidylprolyl isomerase
MATTKKATKKESGSVKSNDQVKKGDWVLVSYTGKLSNGTVFDSSEDFYFEVGAGKVIPGFDSNILSMAVGTNKEFTIPCKEAYGEMSDDNKQAVPKEFFKDIKEVKIGMIFMAQTPMGPIKVKILTMEPTTNTVSLNHPLAGEDLTFDIKVVKILTEMEVKAKEEIMKKQYEEMMAAQGGSCGSDCGSCGSDCEGHKH